MKNIEALALEQKKDALPQWQDPIPFTKYSLPKFEIDALPSWIRDYVVGVAESTQTPLDAAGMMSISILSTILSKKAYVSITPEWDEPLNTYILLALPSGNRKSSVSRLLQDPIIDYEKEEQKRMETEILRKNAELKAKNKRLESLERDFTKNGDDTILDEITQLSNEINKEIVPAIPRYITGDITAEKLGVLLSENNEKIAILSAEGGGVFSNMAGRYSGDGKANIEIYLNGYSGDYVAVDRIGREPIVLEYPCITIGLFVQPQVLRDVPLAFQERGLMQRFLYSFPNSMVGHRKVDPNPIDVYIKETYLSNIRQLLELNPSEPIQLKFSEEAALMEKQIRQEIEVMLREGELLADLKEWGSKLAGQLIRISGLFHIAEHVNSKVDKIPTYIDVSTLNNTRKLMMYFIMHAQIAYDAMGVNVDSEDAKYLLKYLIINDKRSYSKREVFQGTKGTLKNAKRFEAAVAELEERYFIQREETNSTGKGRRSYNILLNPKSSIPDIPINQKMLVQSML
ncbi:YfjI family protein [Bacillus altitudinis]|uniref:YfjI family protein n=1 Tax=Bacillus altitudinis TaxID=293387 RepID=UPI003CF271C8